MPRITIGTLVKLLIWSLVVGALLAFFDVRPQDIWSFLLERAKAVYDNFEAIAGNAISYVLLGAVIVVPVWLIFFVSNWLGNRR